MEKIVIPIILTLVSAFGFWFMYGTFVPMAMQKMIDNGDNQQQMYWATFGFSVLFHGAMMGLLSALAYSLTETKPLLSIIALMSTATLLMIQRLVEVTTMSIVDAVRGRVYDSLEDAEQVTWRDSFAYLTTLPLIYLVMQYGCSMVA